MAYCGGVFSPQCVQMAFFKDIGNTSLSAFSKKSSHVFLQCDFFFGPFCSFTSLLLSAIYFILFYILDLHQWNSAYIKATIKADMPVCEGCLLLDPSPVNGQRRRCRSQVRSQRQKLPFFKASIKLTDSAYLPLREKWTEASRHSVT